MRDKRFFGRVVPQLISSKSGIRPPLDNSVDDFIDNNDGGYKRENN